VLSLKYFRQLLVRFLVLLFLSGLVRIGYYLYNHQYFPVPDFNDWVILLVGGLRFDVESLIYINSLFIILSVLPVPFKQKKFYSGMMKWFFIIPNLIYFIVEITDLVYFQYVFRRINGSDLSIVINSFDVIPSLAWQHPEGIFLMIVLGILLWFVYKKTEVEISGKLNYIYGAIVFVLTLGIAVIGSRGGLQLRPLSPISASNYVSKKELTPLVSNGTIHLLFATEQSYLNKKNYFTKSKAYELFSPVRKPKSRGEMNKKNIVLITLESFGKEYFHYFNKDLDKTYTPFLDSLIGESLLFSNAYACGNRSPYGIAGLGGSIPTLMQQAISFSAYQTNCIDGLGSLLNDEGYTTGFFHGARPSSMNIDRLGKLEGFTNIYTKREFNDDSKFDGNWGIWDDHFFQFMLKEINEYQEPFGAYLFSMTSHPPYVVEKWFEDEYPDEDPILRSVHYTDYSLRHFFDEARKQPWFENTIFVFSADHIGRSFNMKYTSKYAKYQIPIFFYTPDNTLRGTESNVFMQTDVIPTLLNHLNYPKEYNAFGVDVFDTTANHFAYTYSNGIYQILDNEDILFFDGNEDKGFYNYKSDVEMKEDIGDKNMNKRERMLNYLKALIQIHNELMFDNKICNYNFNKNK